MDSLASDFLSFLDSSLSYVLLLFGVAETGPFLVALCVTALMWGGLHWTIPNAEYEIKKFAAFAGLHQLALPVVLRPILPADSLLAYADAYLTLCVVVYLLRLRNPRMHTGLYRYAVSIPSCASISYTCFAALFVPLMPFAPFYARVVPLAMGAFGLAQCLFANPRERVHLLLDSTPLRSAKSPSVPVRCPQSLTFTTHTESAPLPSAFLRSRPLRICQITDTHLGVYMSISRLHGICKDAVKMRPDLFLLTGDYLTYESVHTPGALQEALLPLREAPGRVFACLGNHDYDTGALSVVRSTLRSLGIRLLENEQEFVTIDGFGTVQIIGSRHHFSDRATRLAELCKLCPRQAGVLRVLLLHDPGAFKHVPEGEADLVLSGHTHGGIWGLHSFGLMWTAVSGVLRMPDHGFWANGSNRLYVHRGQGNHGIPLRFGVASQEGLLFVHRTPDVTIV